MGKETSEQRMTAFASRVITVINLILFIDIFSKLMRVTEGNNGANSESLWFCEVDV